MIGRVCICLFSSAFLFAIVKPVSASGRNFPVRPAVHSNNPLSLADSLSTGFVSIRFAKIVCYLPVFQRSCTGLVWRAQEPGADPSSTNLARQPWESPLGLIQGSISRIGNDADTAKALVRLVLAQQHAGQQDAAASTRKQLNELATTTFEKDRPEELPGNIFAFLIERQTKKEVEAVFAELIRDCEFELALDAVKNVKNQDLRTRQMRQILDSALVALEFKHAIAAAMQLGRLGYGDDAFVEVVSALCENELPDQASELLEHVHAEEARVKMLGQVALAYLRNGNQTKAEKIARQANSILSEISKSEDASRELVADALVRTGLYQMAWNLIENLEGTDRHAYLLQTMTQKLLEVGQPEMAIKWLERSGTAQQKVLLYLNACRSPSVNSTMALSLINKAARLASDVNSPPLRSRLRQQIASEFVERGENESANILIAQEVEDINNTTKPAKRLFGYCQLAAFQSGLGDKKAAESSLQLALGELDHIEFPFNRSLALGNIAVAASILEDTTRLQTALFSIEDLLEDITNPNQRFVVIFNISMDLVDRGKIDEAKTFVQKFLRSIPIHSIAPHSVKDISIHRFANIFRTLGIFNNLIRAQAFDSNSDSVLQILNLARQATSQNHPARAMQLLDKAGREARKIETPLTRSNILKEIAFDLIRIGDLDRASKCLLESAIVAHNIKSESDRVGTYSIIALYSVLLQDIEKASSILNEISSSVGNHKKVATRAAVLVQVASAWLDLGATNNGMEILVEMTKETISVSTIELSLASELYRAKRYSLAAEAIQRAADKTIALPPGLRREHELKRVVFAMLQVGDTASAFKIAGHIDDSAGRRSIAYRDASIQLANMGKLEQALEFGLQVGRSAYRAKALGIVGSKLDPKSNQNQIDQIESNLLSVAAEFDYPVVNGINSPQCEVATALALIGRHESAYLIADRPVQGQRRIRTSINREITHGVMTRLIRSGHPEKALEFAMNDSEQMDRDSGIKYLATSLTANGYFEKAFEALKYISDESNQIWTLGSIASICYRARNLKSAQSAVQMALRIAEDSKTSSENSYALRNLASVVLGMDDIESALITSRLISKPDIRAGVLESVAAKAVEMGNAKLALRLLSISAKMSRNFRPYKIASSMAKSGNTREAIQVINLINEPSGSQIEPSPQARRQNWLEANVWNDVAGELARVGEFQEALEMVQKIEQSENKQPALQQIALEMVEHGLFQKAMVVSPKAFREEIIQQIFNVTGNSPHTRFGQPALDQAKTVAANLPDKRASLLHAQIINWLVDSGEFKSAVELAQQLGDAQKSWKFEIAYALATKPIRADGPSGSGRRRMKAALSEEEKSMAIHLYKMSNGNK